jgi:hypothetical protein
MKSVLAGNGTCIWLHVACATLHPAVTIIRDRHGFFQSMHVACVSDLCAEDTVEVSGTCTTCDRLRDSSEGGCAVLILLSMDWIQAGM